MGKRKGKKIAGQHMAAGYSFFCLPLCIILDPKGPAFSDILVGGGRYFIYPSPLSISLSPSIYLSPPCTTTSVMAFPIQHQTVCTREHRERESARISKNTTRHEIPQMATLPADWLPRPADGGRLRVDP